MPIDVVTVERKPSKPTWQVQFFILLTSIAELINIEGIYLISV